LDHPSLPQGQLVYAIGDIHGRVDLLTRLLAQIEADAKRSGGVERKALVFLGDYVDRGPDSRRVVDVLLGGLPKGFNAHFLKGNHEAMLLDFLQDPSTLGQWLANGAATTLQSYGVNVSGLARADAEPELWRDAFLARLPRTHFRFFDDLELAVSFGDYFFVHAGVRPGVPLDAQSPLDLIWIRGEFLRSKEGFGKMVVHGHTPGAVPDLRANRIGIDTGAVFTNRLTALRLANGARGFLQTEEE
jgi:serine/threonine protein phosphatase 1